MATTSLTDTDVRTRDAVTRQLEWDPQVEASAVGSEVAPQAVGRDVRKRIVQALHRNADVDARHITVTVAGDTAALTGTVGSWWQSESAERAAASAPGIARVDNRIVVEPPYQSFTDDSEEIC